MIPKFPDFKKLELSDKDIVEDFVSKYPPYSDFNFISLWAWDTDSKRMISELNNNLVVYFTDYLSGEPFISFIGTNKVERTSQELITYAQSLGIDPKLRFIPEESVRSLSKSKL